MLRFVLIRLNRHESSPLLSIRKSGSRFARDLEFVAPLGFEGGLKMLRFVSIRSNRDESSPLLSIRDTGSRFADICSATGVLGWFENVVDSCRFDRNDTNRLLCCRFVIPEVDLHENM